ncbi:ABC transporter permease [Bacillus carboniphilus]|uniref:ABC transporter permease n=1 Tax=Bacillus carboniphilus TaxID=86663 RepID=A0ABY9JY81_9BACI|nr:ABC transporter permease [Bacillus carboniphilus]WLR44305.1 ABC transporter permease [Bacillus carboniphilus]
MKRDKISIICSQLLIVIFFFSFWQLASDEKWIDPLIFSSPAKIFDLFISKMLDGTLLPHVSLTIFETILGFLIGTILGTGIAMVLWFSKKLARIMDPFLVILNAMPKVALGPLLIVGLGPNLSSIVAMGAIICVVITTIVVYSAFKVVDQNYKKVLLSFGASKWDIFKESVLPASLPTIISTLKVNVGLSWVGIIVGEFLVSKQGLGYLIIYGFQVFNFTLVLLSLLLVACFATIMYQGVSWLEKRLIRHH